MTVDLRLAELRVFSQNGEDGIIAALLAALPVQATWFVEFGVEDGIECNTRFLAEVMGWSGVYFEPALENYEFLARRWAGSPDVKVANHAVTPQNIHVLFAEFRVPEEFGVLSIDVDGQDYWIWEALPESYKPAMVVIECNASFRRGSSLVEMPGLPWTSEHSDTFGASTEALRVLGERRGYALVHIDLAGVNAFFVRADLLNGVDLIGITSRSANYDLQGSAHPAVPVRPTVQT